MALEHAIMTSLAERAGTGYEIGRQFERSIGHFWSASHQQIYRTLKKLHADGLVNYEAVPQQGRPDKKVYQLSDAGREAMHAWISEPSEIPRLRADLGVKVRAATADDIPALLDEIRRHRDEYAARVALYQSFEHHDFAHPDTLTGRRLHQYLVLRGGIIGSQAAMNWCDELLHALERTAPAPALNGAPSRKVSDDARELPTIV